MPILSAVLKGKIKTHARKWGLLEPINALEYWYANRISADALAFYRPYVPVGSLVFDVGAHLGLKARLFLQLGAKVVAVEPMPDCVVKLRKFPEHPDRLTVFEGGCASAIGTAELHACAIHPQNSTLSREFRANVEGIQSDAWQTVTIQATTLDALIAQHGVPGFCKIDTEGFEDQVLAGLSTKIPALSFEFALPRMDILESCLARLTQIGYREFNFISGRIPALQLENWLSEKDFLAHVKTMKVEEGDVLAR